MSETPNFRPRVIEPMLADGSIGVGVELEFHEDIPGLTGDTIMVYLKRGTSYEQAQELVSQIHRLGVKVSVSNPRS